MALRDSLRRSNVTRLDNDDRRDVTINDDDEERRQARRRTLQASASSANDSSIFEENETLKKCLEIYNDNKLSRENAWSVSLIDTLSSLLDRHHKSLNNFKVAGSSLEASSKVYGLRVDSIHIDVLRMSAGLNAKKFSEQNIDNEDDDDAATGGDGAADPSSAVEGAEAAPKPITSAKSRKRARKPLSTITKNTETLNARLDMAPLQDPVFGKLNSIVGSINASNRMMINILPTTSSGLKLRTNFRVFDVHDMDACDYTKQPVFDAPLPEEQMAPCDRLLKIQQLESLFFRPLHSGYIISDTPEAIPDDRESCSNDSPVGFSDNDVAPADDRPPAFLNSKEMSMAFDINAECEPLPPLDTLPPVVDIDFGDYDDLTTEDLAAINNCRGLRKAPVVITDLRPVDANSKLEYSYRPLDKISQFWAGPSHWKFRRVRSRPSTLSQAAENTGSGSNIRSRRIGFQQKKLLKQLDFTSFHDELFIKLNTRYKGRRANIMKKWDSRKVKLPTDLKLTADIFDTFTFAPGIPRNATAVAPCSPHTGEDNALCMAANNLEQDAAPVDNMLNNDNGDIDMSPSTSKKDDNPVPLPSESNDVGGDHFADAETDTAVENEGYGERSNNTVLEIPTEFEGAPSQVTKIIVPFAKRAKVIDMKKLKRACILSLQTQMAKQTPDPGNLPVPAIPKDEIYGNGIASFNEMYRELPNVLNPNMVESVSLSIAFYSVLHLANDNNLRLIQQENLEDFAIRQVVEQKTSGTNTTSQR